MRGMYGVVSLDGLYAVKQTKLYDEESHTVMGCNISEGALGVTVCRTLPNVVNFRAARCVGNNKIAITMDKGDMTLHQYIMSTPFIERMKNITRILRALLTGLNALHTRGLAHCDFKPSNIVMEDGGDPFIIDLGSMRFIFRARHGEETDVICTYTFAAPEALEPGSQPAVEHDAYSLGVVLYFYIYKAYVAEGIAGVQTREDALRIHKDRKVMVPVDCPAGVDPKIFDAMCGLLHADPMQRTRISDLAAEFLEASTPKRTPYNLILDRALPADDDRDRAFDVDWLFNNAFSKGSFPLAVSIRDRSGARGEVELRACARLAHMTLYPDAEMMRPRRGRPSVVFEDIIKRVNFELYSDTAEWVLWLEHGVEKPDPELLRDAIKEAGGDTRLAVRIYTRKRPAPDEGDSPALKRMTIEIFDGLL